MAETKETETGKKKGGMLPLLLGVVMACGAGAGGFYASTSGMLGEKFGGKPGGGHGEEVANDEATYSSDVAYVPIDPLLVTLDHDGERRHLRFVAQLEVVKGQEKLVAAALPRVSDVLNGYLRAVRLGDASDSAALVRLRAQMLRRLQIVIGGGAVSDLLVMEFVLS